MATYDIEFSESLLVAGRSIEAKGLDSFNAYRSVLYLSLLSMEIALKSFLETAGVSVAVIRSRSHNIERLMNDVCLCEVEADIGDGELRWVSAARLRAITIKEEDAEATIGDMLSDLQAPKSQYPNEIRYGEKIIHYPSSLMLNAAEALVKRIKGYGNRIRIKSGATVS